MTTPTYRLVHSGVKVDLIRPDPALISLDDIAHHLSQLCRYGGACDTFYSVAQHCVHVSRLVEAAGWHYNSIRWALLHDASEYVLDDLGSPVKQAIRVGGLPSPYDRLQELWDEAIAKRFRAPTRRVKHFDTLSLLAVRAEIGPFGLTDAEFIGADASTYRPDKQPPRIREVLRDITIGCSIADAKALFLARAYELEIA